MSNDSQWAGICFRDMVSYTSLRLIYPGPAGLLGGIMTLSDTIYAYYMPLYNKDINVIEYYSDIFEAINCTIWQATERRPI